ncbi:protein NETWORKED 2A-like [Bidens hawaiensis]|uniref:protein NETWORKED 2A-like n=1 Tax=Bidens hawaiensis TaxID=980011 RepID=UPI00404B8A38
MTERATGKAHSWLWASHIRTKQSKWLEQNLQDMEYKVEHVLNLIQKDGDSFAKRAEMYYKHRPEVIGFVEDTARSYRSLAERYDKLSTELQKANTTIASICPEKVTYKDDDDYSVGPSKLSKKPSQKAPKKAIKIPKAPILPAKGVLNNTSKTASNTNPLDSKKDDQLKSCEETIKMLQDKQEKMSQEAKLEQQRFEEAKSKLESLKHKFNLNEDETNVDKSNDSCVTETIDKLVNKMITLEASVVSQTTLSDMMKKDNDDLQTRIQILEAEKAALMNMKTFDNKVETRAGKIDQVMWLEMLLNGFENKDDILLEKYVAILKSYKDTKNKLTEEKKRNRGTLSLMNSAIVERDNTIQQLVQKLKVLQESLGEDRVDIPTINFDHEPQVVSPSEEKLRKNIDAILDQNNDLWLRLSTTFRQIHRFKKQVKDLQEEVKKVEAKGLAGKSSTSVFTTDELLSGIKPTYIHLQETNTRLTGWLQQSIMLNDELETINSRLCNIQEEIIQEKVKVSTHQAAKFKGEILNMKQENNKVNEELEAGLDHAIALKHEIEQTLERLEVEFGLSTNQKKPRKGKSSRRSLSLRSLLFGGKSKKQKFSFFSCLGGHQKRTRSM